MSKNLVYNQVVEVNDAGEYLEHLKSQRRRRRQMFVHQRLQRDRELGRDANITRVSELWDKLRAYVLDRGGGTMFEKMMKLAKKQRSKKKKHGMVAEQLEEMFERTYGFTFHYDWETASLMILNCEEASLARNNSLVPFEKFRKYQDMRIASTDREVAVWNVSLGVNLWVAGAQAYEVRHFSGDEPRRKETREQALARMGIANDNITREYGDGNEEDLEAYMDRMEEERAKHAAEEEARNNDWRHALHQAMEDATAGALVGEDSGIGLRHVV